MKHFIISILIVFISASGAFATNMFPDNIQSGPAVIRTNSREVTDYNIALRKKLEDDFHKKYPATLSHDKDGYPVYSHYYPKDAYYNEVQVPYDRNKKPDNYKIISK